MDPRPRGNDEIGWDHCTLVLVHKKTSGGSPEALAPDLECGTVKRREENADAGDEIATKSDFSQKSFSRFWPEPKFEEEAQTPENSHFIHFK